jgi:hypothetical protein
MVAAWRWDNRDQFPNGRRFGEELLRSLREGPPWPTLDTVTGRLSGLPVQQAEASEARQ